MNQRTPLNYVRAVFKCTFTDPVKTKSLKQKEHAQSFVDFCNAKVNS